MDKNSEPVKFSYVCGPLLLYWVIQFVAQLVAELAVMIPHVGEVIDYEALENTVTTDQMTEMFVRSMEKMYEVVGRYMLPILAFGALCTLLLTIPLFLKDRKKERQMHREARKVPGMKKYVVAAAFGAAFCVGLNCLLMLSTLAMSNIGTESAGSLEINLGLQMVCVGIFVPISEEMMFRGLLFRRFRERSTFFTAALMSALIFGLAGGGLTQLIYAGTLGMFLCYAYEVCGTIKVPILLHMVVNMMGIVLTDTPIGSWILEDPMRMGAATVLSAFIGSSMYVLLRNMKKGEPVHTEETDTGNPPSLDSFGR